MMLTIILTCLLAISAVSATENATEDIVSADDVVSVENNNETVVASENQCEGAINVENQEVNDGETVLEVSTFAQDESLSSESGPKGYIVSKDMEITYKKPITYTIQLVGENINNTAVQ